MHSSSAATQPSNSLINYFDRPNDAIGSEKDSKDEPAAFDYENAASTQQVSNSRPIGR